MNQFLTKCVLSLFNNHKIQQITVLCRLTNTGLFAFSTMIVHWSVTPIMSFGQDQSFSRVRLYHDWYFRLEVKLNFQWWYKWQNKWFIYPQAKQFFTVRTERNDLFVHWYWTYLQRWTKFDTKFALFIKNIQWNEC